MELVVVMIMTLVSFSFVLKLTCHNLISRIILGLVCGIFVLSVYDYAASQSKSQIADWLSQPDLMLDTSVWLTIDVAFQICFCFFAAKAMEERLSMTEKIIYRLCLWLPGLLVFPVLFAILTELIFNLPGIDFKTIGWGLAVSVSVVFPLLSSGFNWLVPEREIRLEMIFMTNMLIAALGIVATVNGRTAATGTNTVEWGALSAVIFILAIGLSAGLLINKYVTRKKISKIK